MNVPVAGREAAGGRVWSKDDRLVSLGDEEVSALHPPPQLARGEPLGDIIRLHLLIFKQIIEDRWIRVQQIICYDGRADGRTKKSIEAASHLKTQIRRIFKLCYPKTGKYKRYNTYI